MTDTQDFSDFQSGLSEYLAEMSNYNMLNAAQKQEHEAKGEGIAQMLDMTEMGADPMIKVLAKTQSFRRLSNYLAEKVNSGIDSAKGWLSEKFNNAISGIDPEGTFGSILRSAGVIPNDLSSDDLAAMARGDTSVLQRISSTAQGAARGAVARAEGAARGLVGQAEGAVRGAAARAEGAARGMANRASGAVGELIGQAQERAAALPDTVFDNMITAIGPPEPEFDGSSLQVPRTIERGFGGPMVDAAAESQSLLSNMRSGASNLADRLVNAVSGARQAVQPVQGAADLMNQMQSIDGNPWGPGAQDVAGAFRAEGARVMEGAQPAIQQAGDQLIQGLGEGASRAAQTGSRFISTLGNIGEGAANLGVGLGLGAAANQIPNRYGRLAVNESVIASQLGPNGGLLGAGVRQATGAARSALRSALGMEQPAPEEMIEMRDMTGVPVPPEPAESDAPAGDANASAANTEASAGSAEAEGATAEGATAGTDEALSTTDTVLEDVAAGTSEIPILGTILELVTAGALLGTGIYEGVEAFNTDNIQMPSIGLPSYQVGL